jgi:hypothetical protein
MSGHKEIRLSLYDYVEGSLDEKQRALVEEHLRSCKACAEDLHWMREAFSLVVRPKRSPSTVRSDEFWATFAAKVEEQIRERHHKTTRASNLRDVVRSYLFFHRSSFALAGMATAVILLIIVLVNRPAPTHEYVFVDSARSKGVPLEPRSDTAQETGEQTPTVSNGLIPPEYATRTGGLPLRVRYADNRMSQYLRKSKALLIGIANLKTDEAQPLDLSVERRASRELVREARYLKQRPLDPRVDDLVNSMNRILIEMANISRDKQIPNVEIVRSGIRQENLLFKIRMAEAVYDSAHIVYAKGIR